MLTIRAGMFNVLARLHTKWDQPTDTTANNTRACSNTENVSVQMQIGGTKSGLPAYVRSSFARRFCNEDMLH